MRDILFDSAELLKMELVQAGAQQITCHVKSI